MQGEMFMTLTCSLFLWSTILTDASLSRENARQQDCSGLKVMTSSPEKVEIEFCSPSTGKGVRIMSEVSTQGTGRLLINTLNGEAIVAAERPHSDKATLMSILGNHFLIEKNSSPLYQLFGLKDTVEEQVISDDDLLAVKTALYLGMDTNTVSSEVSVQARQEAFTNLLNRAEVQLIAKAARALGESGVSGKDNQAARVLYVYGMRLASAQEKLITSQDLTRELTFKQLLFAMKQSYENEKADSEGMVQCNYYNTKCPQRNCPQGSNCVGMCGPKCTCWIYVCGDCCFHEGCYQHDLCCGKNGYVSWGCLKVPFNFKCNSYNC